MLTTVPPPLLLCSLSLRCRGSVIDVSLRLGHTLINGSLHCDLLWFAVVCGNGICCKKKRLTILNLGFPGLGLAEGFAKANQQDGLALGISQ